MSPHPLASSLQRNAAFANLSAGDLDALATALEVRRYDRGHVFITEGERSHDVFYVVSGEVEVLTRGAVWPVRRLWPGSLFGLVALVDDEPRSATCRAAEPSEVATLSARAVPLLFNNSAPVACAFQKAAALQLAEDFRNLSTLLHHLDAGG